MSIKMVLFDLDGTLLPMDQDVFVKTYFGMLAKKMSNHGYEPSQLIDAIWSGTAAMVKNDGSKLNEAAFWEDFETRFGERWRTDLPLFDEFYRTEFEGARSSCGFNPRAAEAVAYIKSRGFRVALATNPIFPAIATEHRIRWAGLEPEDFELYTTYENSRHSKPNPAYYTEVAERLGVAPEECLMVGNDAAEDTAAEAVGMKVFLLTDCLISRDRDISAYPNGGFDELLAFIDEICE